MEQVDQPISWPLTSAFNANFDRVAEANPTIEWRELEIGKIYAVTIVRYVNTRFGEAAVGRVVLPNG